MEEKKVSEAKKKGYPQNFVKLLRELFILRSPHMDYSLKIPTLHKKHPVFSDFKASSFLRF